MAALQALVPDTQRGGQLDSVISSLAAVVEQIIAAQSAAAARPSNRSEASEAFTKASKQLNHAEKTRSDAAGALEKAKTIVNEKQQKYEEAVAGVKSAKAATDAARAAMDRYDRDIAAGDGAGGVIGHVEAPSVGAPVSPPKPASIPVPDDDDEGDFWMDHEPQNWDEVFAPTGELKAKVGRVLESEAEAEEVTSAFKKARVAGGGDKAEKLIKSTKAFKRIEASAEEDLQDAALGLVRAAKRLRCGPVAGASASTAVAEDRGIEGQSTGGGLGVPADALDALQKGLVGVQKYLQTQQLG